MSGNGANRQDWPGRAALRPTAKATPGHSRVHNLSLVLSCLFHGGPMSRAELARATGLTRVTISDLVAGLSDQGLIVDLGTSPEPRVGKPASLIDINAAGHLIAVLDLSDTSQMRGALITLRGEVLRRAERPAVGATGAAVVHLASGLAQELIPAAKDARLLGVGVASPGVLTPDGTVVYAKDYQWENLPLAEQIASTTGAAVYAANDANLRALAEFTFAGASAQGLMEVSLTDGLGAGILLDGMLLAGPSNAAGEIGHIPAMAGGEPCTCGRTGCLETVLNRRVLGGEEASPGGENGGSVGSFTLSPATLERVGQSTAAVLGPIVSALNLSDLVFADPRGVATPEVISAIRQGLEERILPQIMADLDVRVSQLGADAALLGAGALVLAEQLGLT